VFLEVGVGVVIKSGQDSITSMFLHIHGTLSRKQFAAVQYELFTALLNRPQTGICAEQVRLLIYVGDPQF
jgi:hypothetical protein